MLQTRQMATRRGCRVAGDRENGKGGPKLLLQNYYSRSAKSNIYVALRPVGFAVNYGETGGQCEVADAHARARIGAPAEQDSSTLADRAGVCMAPGEVAAGPRGWRAVSGYSWMASRGFVYDRGSAPAAG